MQSKIRKRRSFRSAGNSRGYRREASSRFQLIPFYILFLLTSCATIGTKEQLSPEQVRSMLNEQLGKVCLSSSGQGRIHTGKNRYLFSYDAENDEEKQLWSLLTEIPLQGDEMLSVDWSQALNGKVSLDGDFYRRILIGLRDRPQLKRLMKVFMLKTAQVISLKEDLLKKETNFLCEQTEFDKYSKSYKGICRFDQQEVIIDWVTSEKDFQILLNIAQAYKYKISFSNESDTGYGKINASLMRLKTKKELFSLNLFIRTCNESIAKQ